MDITVRAPTDDEFEKWADVSEIPFGQRATDEIVETDRRTIPVERTLAAFDGDEMIGTAGAFPFEVGVPGAILRAGGVTMVGVLPSHRRRGIFTRLMQHQLRDLHDDGTALAMLWASESVLYPRFGYGLASWHGSIDIERDRASFIDDPGPSGICRMVELGDAAKLIPPIYDAVAQTRPGMFARSADWWETRVLSDRLERQRGMGARWCVAWEKDGEAHAYAIYRAKDRWDDGFPNGTVEVVEALSTSVEGMREIWRFLFGLDLMSRVRGHFLPVDHPLLHMLAQPDRLRYRLGAGLWIRVIDVESALAGRRYDRDGSFVFRLEDRACPWNDATWRMSVEDGRAHLERTDDEPDLGMNAVELGAIYLGGMGVYELGRAGRIQELSRGALAVADGIFRWHLAPWCPEIF